MASLNGLRRRSRSPVGAVVGLTVGLIVLAVGPNAIASANGGSAKAELAKAESELLVHSDFPHGWTAQGSVTTGSSNSSSDPSFQQLGSCLGLSGSLANVLSESTPEADSPTFSHGGDSVQETFDIYPSATQASESYHISTLSKVPECFSSLMSQPSMRAQLESSFGSGSTLGTVQADAAPKQNLIPHSAGVVLELPFTQQGKTYDVILGIINWVKGTENPSITFTSVNAGFPKALSLHLEQIAYNRS